MTSPLDALISELDAELRRDPKGPDVAAMLANYAESSIDWRDYLLFREGTYTRSLLGWNPSYELLLLCWGRDQRSPIHNHEGQRCWMAVLDGEIQETHYGLHAEGGSGPLVPRDVRIFDAGRVAYISDEIALHEVRPLNGPGVSLHLYSRPIPQCNVYCDVTGTVSVKVLEYDFVRDGVGVEVRDRSH